jgi:hypothetical protein
MSNRASIHIEPRDGELTFNIWPYDPDGQPTGEHFFSFTHRAEGENSYREVDLFGTPEEISGTLDRLRAEWDAYLAGLDEHEAGEQSGE